MKYPLNHKKKPMLFRKRVWLKSLIWSGLAVITIFFLLPGCGSDSKMESMNGKSREDRQAEGHENASRAPTNESR